MTAAENLAGNVFDVAIVGGGLVGASLAVGLAASSLRVVLIEAAAPPISAAAWDERCIALNEASQRILASFGVWPALSAEAEPIRGTHISEKGRFGSTRFSADEVGLTALGYNAPLRAIGAVLSSAMAAAPNLKLLLPARVTSLEEATDHLSLTVESAGSSRAIKAALVVAADGAQSSIRKLLGLDATTRDYGQHAIVSAVRLSRPHQGVAYERFTPDGPMALIPKPDDAASLVWTVPSANVEAMLAWTDAEYLEAAQATFGGRLGRFTALGQRKSWPLSRVMNETLVGPRTVFIGNAAQSLHPVAAQGFNLGLRDVANLAERIIGAADPGAEQLLADYAATRRSDRERVSGFTDLLVRAFSNRTPGLAQARHWGLVAADLLPPVRAALLRQHLGHLGLPADGLGAPR
ncbi:2-octaprenyl-6-methoxyphenyl hydroxylase [Nevskia ramosa]|uniref:2-octaprenyl-6-methoxyphenyl hydroxylase n=1 Tax=Nevskia ramosa TaxID=64002 RepID=UPI0003B56AB7|nr:2-octaprenyl-6-methoxyphenyl hydroxylase [Nevskia ramosa]